MKAKMADLDALPERVNAIETKLDALSASVDRRFEQVDRRFDEVSEHFAEQRRYTEFAFERLERGLAANTERLDRLEHGVSALGHGVAANTSSLARLERKFDQFIESQSKRAPRGWSPRPKKR